MKHRVMLHLLKSFKRPECRVLVVQSGDKANRDAVLVQVIDKTTAVGFCVQRPAGGVLDQARLRFTGLHPPQFLHADAVGLRVTVLVQFKFPDQLFAQVASAAFGQDRHRCVNFDALHVVVFVLPCAVHTHIADDDTAHCTVIVKADFSRRVAWKNIHFQRFSPLRHPSAHRTQRDNEIAVIILLGWRGQPYFAFFREQPEFVFCNRDTHGRWVFPPAGQ